MEMRIVRLGALHVAAARAIGAEPEADAFRILVDWARSRGLLGREGYRVFGFNNPSPTPGSPVYGYEVWMTVGPEVRPDGPVQIKDFAGGLYAVARIRPRSGDDISRGWEELHRCVAGAGRCHGSHQWLEEHIGPLGAPLEECEMDLYYPLAE
ncbi:MAG: GyrI-like domain-containing protein [Anaerolineae bacterium]|nr:GyrI-like domain-containing protein [Anaerolineae bacterium]